MFFPPMEREGDKPFPDKWKCLFLLSKKQTLQNFPYKLKIVHFLSFPAIQTEPRMILMSQEEAQEMSISNFPLLK